MGLINKSAEIEALAREVPDSGGVHFVPALTGLGAPYWWPEARGAIVGLTRGSTKAHIARATLDGMAFQNAEILGAMEKDSGKKLKQLKVDGGAAANNLLMEIQADLIGVPVERPANVETTALGAAFLAGLGVGFWKDLEEIKTSWQSDRIFEPQGIKKERQERLTSWRRAVQRVK